MADVEKGYNLNQVASLLGIKVRTVRKWVAEGIIAAHKIAGTSRWIVMESEVRRLQNNGKGSRAE